MAAKFNNFNLDDFTMSADEYCVASTQYQAELCFLRQGIFGDVFLAKVNTVGAAINADIQLKKGKKLGAEKLFWVCKNEDGEICSYLPLFVEDANLDDMYYTEVKAVSKNMLFENNGIIYILLFDTSGKAIVRIVTVYFSQIMIEGLAELQGFKFKEIYMVKLHTIPKNEYVGACWSLVFEEQDDDGETVDSNMLMPVDVFDSQKFSDIGLKSLNSSIVHENDTVKIGNVFYTLKFCEDGKRYLLKNAMQPVVEQPDKVKQLEELRAQYSQEAETQNSELAKYSTKIIPLFKKGEH